MSRQVVTSRTGSIHAGHPIRQFKVLNNQPFAMWINLSDEIPDANNYQYLVAARSNYTSPEVVGRSLSWALTDISAAYPQPEIVYYASMQESPALQTRELQAQELVAGYPFVSGVPVAALEGYDLPEIPIFNHVAVMFLISNRNPATAIGYVLRNRVPFYVVGAGAVDYLYACGNRGVYTYVPSEESLILSPRLFAFAPAAGDLKESTVYAYYTRTPLTLHPPQNYLVNAAGTEGGPGVSSVTPQTFCYGLDAGQYRLTIFYRPSTVGATKSMRAFLTFNGVDTADIFEQQYTVLDTGETNLFFTLTTVTYQFIEAVISVPRPLLAKLVLTTASNSTLQVYPTMAKVA